MELPVSMRWLRVHISMGHVVTAMTLVLAILAASFIHRKHEPRVFKLIHDLPAYTVLRDADVQAVETAPVPTGAITEPSKIVGRVTILPLESHTVLLDQQLVELPADVRIWSLISAPTSPALSGAVGQRVMLIGVSEDSDVVDRLSNDAVLLALRDGQAILALLPNDAIRAATYTSGKRHLVTLPILAALPAVRVERKYSTATSPATQPQTRP